MGSEMYSAPAGTVTSALPAKVNARSEPGSIWLDAAETGPEMCTEVRCSGSVPKAFETCTRSEVPPVETCAISRMVMSRMSSIGRAFCGSGNCWDAAQVATQLDCALAHAHSSATIETARRTLCTQVTYEIKEKVDASSLKRFGMTVTSLTFHSEPSSPNSFGRRGRPRAPRPRALRLNSPSLEPKSRNFPFWRPRARQAARRNANHRHQSNTRRA